MKRIIICCDGTWQDSDGGAREVPTNVTRITRALKSEATGTPPIAQVVYYQAGVGTGGTLNKIVGGGTGDGLSENVREAYGFLAHNYHPGDTVHLFGFSRGAYTARSICGLICRIGILTKRGMDNFYEIYKQYMSGEIRNDPTILERLKSTEDGVMVTPDVKVTTIGCWDTVGSLGIPTLPIPILGRAITGASAKDYQFLDVGLSDKVQNAFHALGLDEQRGPFTPTLWDKSPNNTVTNLEQVWFPGVHTNIGGGYDDQEIADMTLAWMINKTAPFLEYDMDYMHEISKHGPDQTKEWAAGKIYDSRSGIMRLTSAKVRTPGGYKDQAHTFESFHISVRVRWHHKELKWACPALQGWSWVPAENAWVKDQLRMKETELGDVEKVLAGSIAIDQLLAETPPTATKL